MKNVLFTAFFAGMALCASAQKRSLFLLLEMMHGQAIGTDLLKP